MSDDARDLLIIGAGPAGLAAAIAAQKAGLDYEVIEKGALVNSIFNFPRNQIFFTTPELLEIGGLPFVTPYEKPTRIEALRYYRRVVETFALKLTLGEEVQAIAGGGGGFVVLTRQGRRPPLPLALPLKPGASKLGASKPGASKPGASGRSAASLAAPDSVASRERRTRNLVIACGYYDHPNRLGVPGEELPHVSHYYQEAHAYYGQSVMVVGGKNSAALAALDLHRHGASVTLVHRRAQLSDGVKYWIRPDIENRIKESAIAARFSACVREIGPECVTLESANGVERVPADAVFLLTGYHPDDGLLRNAGVSVDPGTYKPQHDPATFETNVKGLFVAGSMISGKDTGRIFIENGRFHGEAIVATIRARLGLERGDRRDRGEP